MFWVRLCIHVLFGLSTAKWLCLSATSLSFNTFSYGEKLHSGTCFSWSMVHYRQIFLLMPTGFLLRLLRQLHLFGFLPFLWLYLLWYPTSVIKPSRWGFSPCTIRWFNGFDLMEIPAMTMLQWNERSNQPQSGSPHYQKKDFTIPRW